MNITSMQNEFTQLPITNELHPAQYGIITKFYRSKITELLKSTRLERVLDDGYNQAVSDQDKKINEAIN